MRDHYRNVLSSPISYSACFGKYSLALEKLTCYDMFANASQFIHNLTMNPFTVRGRTQWTVLKGYKFHLEIIRLCFLLSDGPINKQTYTNDKPSFANK